jgi:PAS domain S-box-containing protein
MTEEEKDMKKQGTTDGQDSTPPRSTRSDELRRRAELLIDDFADTVLQTQSADLHKVLQELHVHQIELELQNEELQVAQKRLEESRRSYMRLYHDAPVGYVVLDSAGMIRQANKTFAGMVGDPAAVDGTPLARYLTAEDRSIFLARLRSFRKSPVDKQLDVRLDGPGGPRFVSIRALPDEKGSPADGSSVDELLVTVTDIHQRKIVEKEIEGRRRELEAILAGMSDGFISLDGDMRIRYMNGAAEQLLGTNRQHAIGQGLFDLFAEARGSIFEKEYRTVLLEKRARSFETFFPPHDQWYEVNAAPFQDGLSVFFRVISGRKKAEEAMVESEQRFRSYIAYAPYGIFVSNARGQYQQVNPAACSLTGYRESELLSMEIGEMLSPEFGDIGRAHFQAVKEQGQAQGEVRLRCKDGGERWFSVSAVKVNDDRYLGFIDDIETEKQTLEELHRSRRVLELNHQIAKIFLTSPEDDLFHDVLNVLLEAFASPIGLFGYIDDNGDLVCPTMTRSVWDKCQVPEKSIVFPHAQWGGVWGRALLEQRSLLANEGLEVPAGHVQLHCVLAVPIVQRDQAIGHFILANKEGGYDQEDLDLLEGVADQVAPILLAYLGRLRRRELQKELASVNRQLHKNESLGRMAGAVAHNYNNMLTVILGNLEVALADLPQQDTGLKNILGAAHNAAKRLAELGTNMLIYLGQSPTAQSFPPVDLVPLLTDYGRICEQNLAEQVTLNVRLPAQPVLVAADRDLIRRLLDSLFANGVEALGSDGGSIELTLMVTAPDEITGIHRFPVDWQPVKKDHACIRLVDTGCGMSVENLERIFDPFYTQKFTGRGMGLPLALGIVRMHGGGVTVRSVPNKGSVFKVFFPLVGNTVGGNT